QIASTSETLNLHLLNGSALELAAYLCSFIDDQLVPNEHALEQLAGMVNALGEALSELSGSVSAEVRTLHREVNEEPLAEPQQSTATSQPSQQPRSVCLLGDTARSVPALMS